MEILPSRQERPEQQPGPVLSAPSLARCGLAYMSTPIGLDASQYTGPVRTTYYNNQTLYTALAHLILTCLVNAMLLACLANTSPTFTNMFTFIGIWVRSVRGIPLGIGSLHLVEGKHLSLPVLKLLPVWVLWMALNKHTKAALAWNESTVQHPRKPCLLLTHFQLKLQKLHRQGTPNSVKRNRWNMASRGRKEGAHRWEHKYERIHTRAQMWECTDESSRCGSMWKTRGTRREAIRRRVRPTKSKKCQGVMRAHIWSGTYCSWRFKGWCFR